MSQSDRRSDKRVTLYRARVRDSDEVWEVEYEAVADALHFACRDLREGRRTPLSISEDDVLVHDADAIARLCADESTGLHAATGQGNGAE